jgi:hypothetical protein
MNRLADICKENLRQKGLSILEIRNTSYAFVPNQEPRKNKLKEIFINIKRELYSLSIKFQWTRLRSQKSSREYSPKNQEIKMKGIYLR